ncbi:MAG: 30S ribosomal protein S17, partial [Nanoarchaeota archaeon]
SAKEGDKVRVTECRPLSKTKNFVIVEKLGGENATN